MTDYLFSTPWWLPTSIIAVGLALWLHGNKRLAAGPKRVGLALAGAGVVLALVSYFVKTDVEKVTDGTNRLVASVENQEWGVTESLLAPNCDLRVQDAQGPRYGDRAAIINGAKLGVQSGQLQSAKVTGVDTDRVGRAKIIAKIRVWATLGALGGRQMPSDWNLVWEEVDGAWVVTEIHLIQWGTLSGEDAKSQLPK